MAVEFREARRREATWFPLGGPAFFVQAYEIVEEQVGIRALRQLKDSTGAIRRSQVLASVLSGFPRKLLEVLLEFRFQVAHRTNPARKHLHAKPSDRNALPPQERRTLRNVLKLEMIPTHSSQIG
jgi:hypothetical protein